jgi:hypothetical protein
VFLAGCSQCDAITVANGARCPHRSKSTNLCAVVVSGDKSRRKRSPMADEFGRSGVRVNAVQAGPTETPSRFAPGTKFPVGQARTGRFGRLKGYFVFGSVAASRRYPSFMTVGPADRPSGYGPVACSPGMDSITGNRHRISRRSIDRRAHRPKRSAELQIVDVKGDQQWLWHFLSGVVVAVDAPGERHSDAVDRAEIRGVVARSSVVR